MQQISQKKIETIRQLRRNGMTVRDIEAKHGLSRQTVHRYTNGEYDGRRGHAYKAPSAERHTVSRTLANGTKRSVTADTREQAEKVCNWQKIGDVAAGIVSRVTS